MAVHQIFREGGIRLAAAGGQRHPVDLLPRADVPNRPSLAVSLVSGHDIPC